ncbi:hypothetical protein LguiA_022838 [Lonicera macranthoides]
MVQISKVKKFLIFIVFPLPSSMNKHVILGKLYNVIFISVLFKNANKVVYSAQSKYQHIIPNRTKRKNLAASSLQLLETK